MLCCKFLETAIKHQAVQADDKGSFEVLPDGSNQYYLECPFCGQEMKNISKDAKFSIYSSNTK